jgi:hypothetical protein
VLAEDELNFFVSQTGVDDPSNEMGSAPFHCAKGRPLQGFPKLWKATNEHSTEKNYNDGCDDSGSELKTGGCCTP